MKNKSLAFLSSVLATLMLTAVPIGVRAQHTYVSDKSSEAMTRFACPERTILSGPYNAIGNTIQIAQIPSDQELEEAWYQLKSPCRVLRSFSNCLHPIDGVRFIGQFAYFDGASFMYASCNSRGGLDDNDDMTEPINFEIAFYKMGDDGYPGEQIYCDTIGIIGENTSVEGTNGIYYSFTANLDTEVRLDEGFVAFSACDNNGPFPECWFMLLGNASTGGYSFSQDIETGQYSNPYTTAPPTYCLLGDESKFLGNRAIKLKGITHPTFEEFSDHAMVTVELTNIGETDVSDATLELYIDDKLISTETIDRTIVPGEDFAYTFGARVDCSNGEHTIKVRNVTPDDELVGVAEVEAYVTGMNTSESLSTNPLYITNFKVGDQIDNTSEASTYSDFTNLSATITPGDTLRAQITCAGSDYTHYMKLYIDWNGNGSLKDEGEFVGYSTDGYFNIAVPTDGVEVTEGAKLMRLILSYQDTEPVGYYAVGETEDYLLKVERPSSGAVLSLDKQSIEVETTDAEAASATLTLSNDGTDAMDCQCSVGYVLPHSPKHLLIEDRLNYLENSSSKQSQSGSSAPVYSRYVLNYGGAYDRLVRLTDRNNPLIFANYFPAEMMKALKGTGIRGISIYMGTEGTGELVAYGQKSQSAEGELLASEAVSFAANQWNTLFFSSPLEIDGNDLWIGLKVPAGAYEIGLDYGPATTGYSDLVKSDKWYHLTDLEYNTNLCLQVILEDQSVPALNWLSADSEWFSVPASGSKQLALTLNPQDLEANSIHEGAVILRTSDPVSSYARVPVYLWPNGTTSAISKTMATPQAKLIVLQPKTVIAKSDKEISHLTAFRLNGTVVNYAMGNRLNLSSATKGIYIVRITYADGTDEALSVVIR